MNNEQTDAIANHCRLACETANPRFAHVADWSKHISIVLTVNSGYE